MIGQYVDVNVFDYDSAGGHDLLGSCRLELKTMTVAHVNDDWIDLKLPEHYQKRINRRHKRLKAAGLTSSRKPPVVQIRLKVRYTLMSSSSRSMYVERNLDSPKRYDIKKEKRND